MPHQRLLRGLQLTTLAQSEDPVSVVYAAILILKSNLAECTGCTANFAILCGSLSNNDVDQLAGHDDFLDNFLPSNSRLDFFIRESLFDDGVFRCVRRHNNPAAQLAVDLHGNFNLLFLCQLRARWPKYVPELDFLLA